MAYPFLTVIARKALYEIFTGGSLINTVARDFESDIKAKGETVTVILPETPVMQNAGGAFAATAVNPTTVDLKLDKWRETKPLSVDMKSIAFAGENILNKYALAISEAIREDLEAAILAEILTFTAFTGDAAGTKVPTGIDGVAVAQKAKFDALKAPFGDRYLVAGPRLEAEYWKAFGLASQGGDVAVAEQIKGFMGQKLGINFISNAGADDAAVLTGIAYHKNAVAMAVRPMQVSELSPNTMVTVEYNGIGLTVEAWHDPQTSSDFLRGQILYGLKALTSKGFLVNRTL